MSNRKLLVGSANKGKIIEIREALTGLPLEIVRPEDFGITEEPQEHGNTYAENALEKARFYFARSGVATLADDSGIIVDAMKNELGIHTRRWGAGKEATDKEWIDYFLKRIERETNRRARFICTLAFIEENGNEHLFEGTCNGVITPTLEASFLPGLPISACFKPDGYTQVYSALSIEQKNSTSHRGRALQSFRTFLEQESTQKTK